MAERIVPLHALAHARAGDKGDRLNISLFPYDPVHWSLLADQITPERIQLHFANRAPGRIVRHDLPRLGGFNIVIEDVLGGGVNSSLYLDAHGKCLSFHLLALPVAIPETVDAR